jgi:hypothetical protein
LDQRTLAWKHRRITGEANVSWTLRAEEEEKMAKKIWYSKPLSNIWNQYNSFYRQTRGSPKEFYTEKNQQILRSQYLPAESLQIETNILDLWKLDVSNEFVHIYFKTKDLKIFLSDIRLADIDGIVSFMFENGESQKMSASIDGITSLTNEQKVQTFSFGIHVPYEKEEKGFAFQLIYIDEKDIKLIWSVGQNQGWCSAETYKENQLATEGNERFYASTFRLAINTLAYMKAFPECVKEGVPPTEESECAYTFELSEKVLENINTTKINKINSPHFRKGFFKMLK